MFKLPQLPYDPKSFPHQLSAESFEYHHGKHHQTYITNLNNLIKNSLWESKSLEEIIRQCQDQKILNNALQHWNHSFFWHCITPYKSSPEGELLKQIENKWGNVSNFLKEFSTQAVGNFGSGWTWLVKKNKELQIINTSNAQSPIKSGYIPLLTIDIWQHAYYIDYRNSRVKYVETVCGLINWKFVGENFKAEQPRVKL